MRHPSAEISIVLSQRIRGLQSAALWYLDLDISLNPDSQRMEVRILNVLNRSPSIMARSSCHARSKTGPTARGATRFHSAWKPVENAFIESLSARFAGRGANVDQFTSNRRCEGQDRSVASRLQSAPATQRGGVLDTERIRRQDAPSTRVTSRPAEFAPRSRNCHDRATRPRVVTISLRTRSLAPARSKELTPSAASSRKVAGLEYTSQTGEHPAS